MRHSGWKFVLLGLIMSQPAMAQQEPPIKPTLTIAADEWCPINCSPNEKQIGIGIDLAKAIFEPLGYKINYVIMPWKEALEQVRTGKVDAVVGANKTDDSSLIFPVSYIYAMSDDFYVQAGNPWRYQGMASLAKQRVGVIEDYGYGNVISKFIADNSKVNGVVFKATGDTALKDNINRLLAGKVDVLVESRPVMDYTLQKLKLEDKIEWAGGLAQGPVFIAFSPALSTSRMRAQQLDMGYIKLKNSGALEAMYKPYALKLQ